VVVYLWQLDVLSVGEDDAGWPRDNGLSVGRELDGGAVRKDHAGRTHEGTLGTPLHQSTVAQDQSRGTVQKDSGLASLELNGSAVSKDHARGTYEITLNSVQIRCQLDVLSALGHDARWSHQQDIVSKVVAELFIGAVSPDDTRVAQVSLGEDVAGAALGAGKSLVGELDVLAILGDNAGGTHQHVVVGHLLGELNISGRADDAGGTDDSAVSQELVDGLRCWWGGSIEGSLASGQLEVLTSTCHDARRSRKYNAVSKVV